MQKILGQVRRACTDYNMIEDGDVIGVGLSGGKDSLLLVKALAMYSKFSQQKFSIEAIIIDLFNGENDFFKLKKFCEELGVNFTVLNSNIYEVLFEFRHEKKSCILCS